MFRGVVRGKNFIFRRVQDEMVSNRGLHERIGVTKNQCESHLRQNDDANKQPTFAEYLGQLRAIGGVEPFGGSTLSGGIRSLPQGTVGLG